MRGTPAHSGLSIVPSTFSPSAVLPRLHLAPLLQGLIAAFSVTPSRARKGGSGKGAGRASSVRTEGHIVLRRLPERTAQLAGRRNWTGSSKRRRRRRYRHFNKGKSPAAAVFFLAGGGARRAASFALENGARTRAPFGAHLSGVSPPSSSSTEDRMPKVRSRAREDVPPSSHPPLVRWQNARKAPRAAAASSRRGGRRSRRPSAPALARRLFCQRATRRASGSGRWVGSGEGDRPMGKRGVNRARPSMPATGGREGGPARARPRSLCRSLGVRTLVVPRALETQETQASLDDVMVVRGDPRLQAPVSPARGAISPSNLGPSLPQARSKDRRFESSYGLEASDAALSLC